MMMNPMMMNPMGLRPWSMPMPRMGPQFLNWNAVNPWPTFERTGFPIIGMSGFNQGFGMLAQPPALPQDVNDLVDSLKSRFGDDAVDVQVEPARRQIRDRRSRVKLSLRYGSSDTTEPVRIQPKPSQPSLFKQIFNMTGHQPSSGSNNFMMYGMPNQGAWMNNLVGEMGFGKSSGSSGNNSGASTSMSLFKETGPLFYNPDENLSRQGFGSINGLLGLLGNLQI